MKNYKPNGTFPHNENLTLQRAVKFKLFTIMLAAFALIFTRVGHCHTSYATATGIEVLPYTFAGTNISYTATFPRFDPSLGVLTAVYVGYTTSFGANAISYNKGGTYLPPYWVANWFWEANFQFQLQGPGVNLLTNTVRSAYGSGNFSSPTQYVNINIAPVYLQYYGQEIDPTNSNFSAYIGYGTTTLKMSINFSTAIYPFPATAGGFTWYPSDNAVGAGINESATNTISVIYDYQPAQPKFINISKAGDMVIATLGNISPGEIVTLEETTDFQTWTPISIYTATGWQVVYNIPFDPNASAVFFRAEVN